MIGKAHGPPWGLFLATCGFFAAVLWLGPHYAIDTPAIDRPMLTVIGLYLGACVLYLFALRAVRLVADTPRLGWWILGTSVALRLILLPTPPFQEIDLYRYAWDGAVVCEGVDPYAYPPQVVINAIEHPNTVAHDSYLARLTALTYDHPSLDKILRTIHYAELPSPYPPVSQAVFAFAATTSGAGWSAEARLTWLKAVLTAFDVGVLLLVFSLVRSVAMHRGWALAYGWCPLVLKEFAGSGHLDSIAVFFTTAALAAGVGVFVDSERARRCAVIASALLGLGVGAKLYPVVLAPLLAIGFWRRLGGRATIVAGAVFLATAGATLAPMFWPRTPPPAAEAFPTTESRETGAVSLPAPPGSHLTTAQGVVYDKAAGLKAFLRTWEMNDLLFMIAYENLRWHDPDQDWKRPWFDVTPNAWNGYFWGRSTMAFSLTRAASLTLFLVIAMVLAWRSSRVICEPSGSAQLWLSAAFLTLAWFWLLAPTQNPWYWCWAMPLVCFARSRAWRFVSILSFGYYLRFWLESRFPERGVAGTPYDGEYFFYFVLPWIEFGPILLWLAAESAWRGRGQRAVCPASQTPSDRHA